MPIKTSCPECDKEYTLADTMDGKTVKCKDCGKAFTVKPPTNGIAAKPSTTTKAAKPAVRRKYDDDDDDVPVKKKNGSMGMVLLIGGAVVVVLMLLACGGVGIGALLLFSAASPDPDYDSTASTTSPIATPILPPPPIPNPNLIPNPNPNPLPASLVTQANFNQIKGGMTAADLQRLLGVPAQFNARPDVVAKQFVGDQGSAQILRNGADSITVAMNPDGKSAAWAAKFNGLAIGYLSDPNFVVKGNAPPNPGISQVTKANYDKIKGGMTHVDLIRLLGRETESNVRPDLTALPFVSDKGKMYIWRNGQDSITVAMNPSRQAASWSAVIDNMTYSGNDPAFAVNANPNANVLVTKANYDKVTKGMTQPAVGQLLGQPSFVSPLEPVRVGRSFHFKQHAKWTDGQGGEITVNFLNTGLGLVVDTKHENSRLK